MSPNMTLCFALLNAFVSCLFGQDVGDICSIAQSGLTGNCVLFEHCASAIEGLKKKKRPQHCGGFIGLSPIVCCPDSLHIKENPHLINNIASSLETVGDISLKKCKEYSKRLNVSNCPLIQEVDAGNRIARPQEFSHMALIGFDGPWSSGRSWQCLGNLISEYYVLTTRNCLFSHTAGYAKYVRLGGIMENNNITDKYLQIRNISELIRYPRYLHRRNQTQFALIKMSTPADLNEYVSPACLNYVEDSNIPFHSNDFPYFLSEGQSFKNPMHKVTLKAIEKETCKRTYSYVNDQHVCAALISQIYVQCSPKGALQVLHPSISCMNVLVGLDISSSGCEGAFLPVLYAKVKDYLGWIEKNVWGKQHNP